MGTSGMRWEDLPQTIQYQMLFRKAPKAIFLHLGGNSITSLKLTKFMKSLKKDPSYLSSTFPSTEIIWCDILPRLIWRYNHFDNPKTLNKKARRVNRSTHQTIENIEKGHILSFKIHESMQELFCEDGVHLSECGSLIYVQTIINFIKKKLQRARF